METNVDKLSRVLAVAEVNLLSLDEDVALHHLNNLKVFDNMAKEFLNTESSDIITLGKALCRGAMEAEGHKASREQVDAHYRNDTALWNGLARSGSFYVYRAGETEADKV